MKPPRTPDRALLARLKGWSRLAPKLVIATGCAVLLGWYFDLSLWPWLVPGHIEMKGNTAFGLVLASAALLPLGRSRVPAPARAIGITCALVVLLLGLVTLLEHVSGWDAGIDQLLFRDHAHAVATDSPGRMGRSAALNFALLGAALLLLDRKYRKVPLASVLTLPAMMISLIAFHQHAFGSQAVRQSNELFVLAAHTALAFLLLASAILCARPMREPVAMLASAGPGGTVLRRVLPSGLAMVLVMGWVHVAGQRAELFGTELSTAIVVTLIAVGAAVLLWWYARRLDRDDAARLDAEEQIRSLNTELEQRVTERTAELVAVNQELRAEIVRRKQVSDALKKNEEAYRFLFEANPLPLFAFNHETYRYTAVNQAAIGQYGYTGEEFLGMCVSDLLAPEEQGRLPLYLESVMVGQNYGGVWHSVRKDGTVIDTEIFHHVVELERRPFSVLLALDVTERLAAERALQDHTAQLRLLSQQLLNVQEGERSRIAGELHDHIGQTLTALKLGLQSMRKAAGGAALEGCIELAAQVLGDVRSLSLDLRPPVLDELGLVAALDSHIAGIARSTGLRVRFEAGVLPLRPSNQTATACFRVVQEALANIMRHAGAAKATVALYHQDGMLRLEVTDDGVGFDVEASRRLALAGGSIGLVSMAERATLVGGALAIDSAPGCGTALRASFPLQRPDQ